MICPWAFRNYKNIAICPMTRLYVNSTLIYHHVWQLTESLQNLLFYILLHSGLLLRRSSIKMWGFSQWRNYYFPLHPVINSATGICFGTSVASVVRFWPSMSRKFANLLLRRWYKVRRKSSYKLCYAPRDLSILHSDCKGYIPDVWP